MAKLNIIHPFRTDIPLNWIQTCTSHPTESKALQCLRRSVTAWHRGVQGSISGQSTWNFMCANLHEDMLKHFAFHAKKVQTNGIGEALSILDRGTRKWLGMGGKRQPPAAFLPENEICYPFYRKLCEHWTVLDGSRKSLPTGVQI